MSEFRSILISASQLRRIVKAAQLTRQALTQIPPSEVSDDPLLANMADVLHNARVNLNSTAATLEHLVQRAAPCR